MLVPEFGSERQADGHAMYGLAWLAVLFGFVAALAVLHATGMVVEGSAMLPYALILVLLFAAHLVYTRFRPSPKLALSTGGLALMIASALLAGIVANAGMRLRFPLVDGQLAAMDLAMGIDTPALVRVVADHPFLAELMGLAYSSSSALPLVSAVWLGFRGEGKRTWELALGFGAGIVIAAATSVFFPALGNFSHAGLEGLAGTGLPAGSGVYHLHAVNAYRDGLDPLLDVRKLEGVVTFPSFHIIMATIVAYAFRDRGPLGWLVYLWCALVAVSTVPIGGHYVIDLLAGTLLWAACMALGRSDLLRKAGALARRRPASARLGDVLALGGGEALPRSSPPTHPS